MAKTTRKKLDPDTAPARAIDRRRPAGDIALVVGRDADGVHILRRRSPEAPLEAGLLRPMREGKPIIGEVVSLTQRADFPLAFDVKSEFAAAAAPDSKPLTPDQDTAGESPGDATTTATAEERAGDGPAQVASEAYRKGWDAVWGARRRERSVN